MKRLMISIVFFIGMISFQKSQAIISIDMSFLAILSNGYYLQKYGIDKNSKISLALLAFSYLFSKISNDSQNEADEIATENNLNIYNRNRNIRGEGERENAYKEWKEMKNRMEECHLVSTCFCILSLAKSGYDIYHKVKLN